MESTTTAARVVGVGGSDGGSLSPDTAAEVQQTNKRNRSSSCSGSIGVLTRQQEVGSGGGFSIHDWRANKLARTTGGGDYLNNVVSTATTTATTFLQNGNDSMKSSSIINNDPHQNMLCFSNGGGSGLKSEQAAVARAGYSYSLQPRNNNAATTGGSYHHQHHSASVLNNTAAATTTTTHPTPTPSSNVYLLSGIKGPFTPSQWLELEQQALIYKYITANEPIPRHLLIPIRIALEEAGMFAGLKPSLWGWGDMDPRYYSNRTDMEPGRCRRTDGKKWRCSKDAMPDQKYCERHMNRGRHRSRKLVEAQANIANNNNHSSSSSLQGVNKMVSPATTTTTMKLASFGSLSNSNNSYDFNKNFCQSAASNPLVNNRMMLSSSRLNSGHGMQQQDATAAGQFTFLPPSINLNSSANNSFTISSNAQYSPYSESTPNLFGVPSSGSLINTNYTTYDLNHRAADPDSYHHSHINTFLDEWPKAPANDQASATTATSTFLWPGLHQNSDNTHLSMSSIPMGGGTGPADFMSSTSSPTHDKSSAAAVSCGEQQYLDQTQMFLGVGLGSSGGGCYRTQTHGGESNNNNTTPVSWEVSMGGPLGEVLQSSGSSYCTTTNSYGECGGKKTSSSSSPLNLLPSSSPTGVLQKSALISLSNSSAGSSPRADNSKAIESGGGQSLQ